MKTRNFRKVGAVSCILTIISSIAAVRTVEAQVAPERAPLTNFEPRAPTAQMPNGERAAGLAALRRVLPGVRVERDETPAGVGWITSSEGFLTGPGGEGPAISAATLAALPAQVEHRAAKAFLQEHRALFGFGPEALDKAQTTRDFVTPHNGLRTVVWEQRVAGLPVFEGLFIAHTSGRGELVNLSSHFVPDPETAATVGTPNRRALLAQPAVSAREAVALAAKNLGESLEAEQVETVDGSAGEAGKAGRFRAPGLNGESETRLVWLPVSEQAMRLCWEVVLTSHARGEMFRVLIDTETGEALLRHGLTAYLSEATYRVFTSDSPSPFSPGYSTPVTTQPPLVSRALVTLSALDTNASPNGWIDDGGNETLGNNVDAHTDRNADNVADLPRPHGSPSRVFDFTLDLGQSPTAYTNAAVVQLFYWNNFMHDKLYQLGFVEAAGNFQSNNFGRGGLGNDAVQADAQDGSGYNNANFSTPSDGSPGRMQMYLFTGMSPYRDGDLDAEVVLHEYTHGLSNRRVGGGVGISALQPQGMGEGWSDFYGLSLLSEAGDDVNGVYAAGAYASYLLSAGFTQNYYFGIRRYPYCTDLNKNPLTFKDLDPVQASAHSGVPRSPVIGNTANEVHNMGELWCVTLWDARANLINKYGWTDGNRLMLQLVTDGMNLSPANPTFLQARDAILQADLVDNGGANRNQLWAAFAKRGMGYTATSPASSTTSGVHEAFDVPDDLRISPTTGFVSTGQVGGPFGPACQSYVLSNAGSNALNWVAYVSRAWATLSQQSGSLAPGASNTINVCLSSAVNTFTAGTYTASVVFSNTLSGMASSRDISVSVSPPRVLFFSLDTDPGWSRQGEWAFGKPAGISGGSFGYPDPTAGATGTNVFGINLTGAYSTTVGGPYYLTAGPLDFTGYAGMRLQFKRWLNSDYPPYVYETVEISSNGTTWNGLWTNGPGSITDSAWMPVAFDISGYADNQANVYVRWGHRVGSSGAIAASGWNIDDIEFLGAPPQNLTVTLPASATEGDGSVAGTITASPASTNSVVVTLSSSDLTEAIAPASVTIAAGQSNATFNLTIVDDGELDGPQAVSISASAPGFAPGSGTITIQDRQSASLEVSAPPQVTEGDAPFVCGVALSAPPTANIQVAIASSSPLQAPAYVTMPAGQTSAVFYASVVDDTQINGERLATITAHVPNWIDGTATVIVRDNEATNLTVILPAYAREGDGVLSGAGALRISGTCARNVVVSLNSDDLTELAVPSSVVIPAGQTNVYFDLTIVDDAEIDGAQVATVTATAAGFAPGSRAMTVYDNESPPVPANPLPADGASNVVQTAGLAWSSGAAAGEIITNDVYWGSSPVLGAAQLLGTTTGTNWSLPTLAPLSTYYWQVVARKAGITPGPVWRFTTRGVDHFDLSPVGSPQYVSAPFNLTVTARDVFNGVVSNFNGSVSFRAQAASGGASSSIVITEWDPNTPDYIEFMNVSAAPVNISGWQIHIYDIDTYPNPLPAFIVPAGTLVPSGGIFRVTEMGSAPGVYPNFYTGANIDWVNDTTTPIGILVRDTAGNIIDFAGAGGATALQITNPVSISTAQWSGPSVAGNVNTAYTTQRIGNSDSNNAGDFVITVPTPGMPSLNLVVPFGGGSLALSPSNSTAFANGSWSGNLTILQPGSNVVLQVDDGNGHTMASAPFDVLLQNDLSLTMTDTPDPVSLGGNVTYTLMVANTGPLPAQGVTVTNFLPPGAAFVSAVTSQGTCANDGSLVNCELGDIPAAGNVTITIVASANQAGNLTNWATAYRADTEPFPANNSATNVTPVVLPTVSISDVSVSEGNSGTTNAVFNVSISPPAPLITAINYATADGTASAASDYQAASGQVVFLPGQTNQTVTIGVNGDTLYELNETFTVNLSGATNANVSKSQGICTILNDDTPPTISIGDATVMEGNAGSTNYAVFPVTLSSVCGLSVSVSYSTLNGTATNGSDYIARSGTLTFAPGVTSNSILVAVLGDNVVEPDEDFYVDLSSPAGATLAKREGVGLIVNDDGLPGMVDHFVWGALNTQQYVNEPFAAVITAMDAFEAPVASFNGSANLSGQINGLAGTNTILTNTSYYSYSYYGYTCGYSFTPTNNLTVTHVRSYSGTKVSIWTDLGILLASQPVSGTNATWTDTALSTPLQLNAGTTYRLGVYGPSSYAYYSSSGPTNFANGTMNMGYYSYGDVFPSTSVTIRWFFVDVRYSAGGAGLVVAPTATGPFTNGVWSGNIAVQTPATNLVLRADDGSGHSGLSSPPMTVSLRNDLSVAVMDSPRPVCVGGNLRYSLVVSNTGPASATGVTLTNWLPGNSTFVSATASQGSWTIAGKVVSFNLGTLGPAASASLGITITANQTGTLTNTCTAYRAEAEPWPVNNTATTTTPVVALPSLAIADTSAREGNAGTTNLLFQVTLWPPPVLTVTVNYATANGTAVTPADYAATNGVLSFGPGETNKSVTVSVNGNTVYSSSKIFYVNLMNALNAGLSRSQAVGTIINDDPAPVISISDATVVEGNIGTTSAVFTVTLSSPSSLSTMVYYSTISGTAVSGSDFLPASGTLTIPPLTTSTNITVAVIGDFTVEPDETFYVDLSSAVNATLGKREGVGTVINDDGLPGMVDHFVWSPLGAEQYVGQAFPVTLAAMDAFNSPAIGFNGFANVSTGGGPRTNTILTNVTYSSYSSGTYTMGYSFTPNKNLTVTHVRSYSGVKVSIWSDSGVLLATQSVSGSSGIWTETPLATPLTLVAGTTYRVGFYTGGGAYYYSSTAPTTFPDGTINQNYYSSGDAFPSTASTSLWFVDLRYNTGPSIPVTPALAGPFTNGSWTGNLALLSPATNVVLRADDGNGHAGTSASFNVVLWNNLSVVMTDSPRPVGLGANLTYAIGVSNSGPNAATGVTLTNLMPAGAGFVSGSSSQGTVAVDGSVISCDLDTVGPTSNVTVSLVVVVKQSANQTNQVTVYRAEPELYLADNNAVTITPVITPAISINDVSLLEGNSGTSIASFTVNMSAGSGQAVYVNYATADGTAMAPSDYVATNGVLCFAPGETNKMIAVLVNGDTLPEPDETFLVTLFGATNALLTKAVGVGTILNDEVSPAVYIRSTLGEPWSSPANDTAMNRVFGTNNWRDLRFETVNPAALFNPSSTFIFMEGSDSGAAVLESFLTTNLALIQNWVSNGGNLFLNAAPNLDNGMSFGFGVTLSYPVFTDLGVAVSPAHPIFNNPFAPVGLSWSGTHFGHATVSGNGLVALITNSTSGAIVLGEKTVGAGRVIFGGMTTDNFHSPQPQASNLRANILAYTSAGAGVDLAVLGWCSPANLYVGGTFQQCLTITNCGPRQASGVAVTNLVPAALTVGSVTCSTGTWTNLGGTYIFTIGGLAPASAAYISINMTPSVSGTFTNIANLGSAEPDLNLPNNAAASVAQVWPLPVLANALNGQLLTLSWSGPGVLQSATNVTGPFLNVSGAASPYVIDTSAAPRLFFRISGAGQ